MSGGYEAVIGLEVHAQLMVNTKLFCGCSVTAGSEPNTQVCPVCLGHPGALPVPNREAIHLAIRAALALDCQVHNYSRFARKHYFYPDMAKGYQISQFELPLNGRGQLLIESEQGERSVGITRIHVEEDAAKNVHSNFGGRETLVDYNRGGVPLIEIVGEPDLRSADEAESYLRRLHELLMYIGVNDGNLEEGSFRCDANVSIRPVGQEAYGTRTELKNINSFRFVRQAIEYEIHRQVALVSDGGTVVQETRSWHEDARKTVPMRGKEQAHDYRYFPDPDLPPLIIKEAELQRAQESVPELPRAMRTRWQESLGLTAQDAGVLSSHPGIAQYFSATSNHYQTLSDEAPAKAGKRIANFIQSEILGHVTLDGLQANVPVTAEHLATLLTCVHKGEITGKMAKEVFEAMRTSGKTAPEIIEEKGLKTVSDVGELENVVQSILEKSASQVASYRDGNQKLLGYFVGQVMKATSGKADPKVVNQVLKRLLEG